MNRFAAACVSATAAFLASAAYAECAISSVSVIGGEVKAQYDYLYPGPTIQRSALQLSASNCRSNRVFVRILPDGADSVRGLGPGLMLRFGNETLLADLQVNSRSNVSTSQLQSRGETSNGLSASATGELSRDDIVLTIQPGQRVAPGRYSARVRINASSDPSDMSMSNAGTPVEVVAEVMPMVGLAAGTGTSLNLGDIRPGGSAVRPVTFQAYSNTPYEIQLSSDNDWKLQRKGPVNGAIDYSPEMTGLGSTHSGQFQPSRDRYHRHDLNVRVGDFQRAGAGVYSDWVTIRIRPLTGG